MKELTVLTVLGLILFLSTKRDGTHRFAPAKAGKS